jgi:hypothetical protein
LTYDARVRALILALFLAGCSHSAVVISNAHPVAPASGLNTSGAVAAAVIIGTVAIAASQEAASPPPAPTPAPFAGWASQPVPGMAPERRVALQDCTKPVDLSAGNLRCR